MRPELWIIFIALVMLWEPIEAKAQAFNFAPRCVKEYVKERIKGNASFGIASSKIEKIVQEIAKSLTVRSGVTVVACADVSDATAFPEYNGTKDIPRGEYIVYNPTWANQVLGDNETQAIFVFGHEFGHFINRDALIIETQQRREIELAADYFGGCAVGRAKGNWSSLEDVVKRLRQPEEPIYPNREASLQIVRKGFDECGGDAAPKSVYDPYTIHYYTKEADGDKVFSVLKAESISYIKSISTKSQENKTVAVACTPDVDISVVKRLAKALRAGGVDIRYIHSINHAAKLRRIEILSWENSFGVFDAPALDNEDIDSLSSCSNSYNKPFRITHDFTAWRYLTSFNYDDQTTVGETASKICRIEGYKAAVSYSRVWKSGNVRHAGDPGTWYNCQRCAIFSSIECKS